MPHKHRVRGVHLERDISVAPVAKNRRSAGIRVNTLKVFGGKRKRPGRVVELIKLAQVKRTSGLLECPVWTAEQQNAKLEAGVNVGKENLAVLEIE